MRESLLGFMQIKRAPVYALESHYCMILSDALANRS